MKKIALIPVYEPDNDMTDLVFKLRENDFDVIIINDGSDEKYDYIFLNLENNAKIIAYKPNRGKGYAIKTGLKFIKENIKEESIIITMDSDGQHTVKDAIKLCSYAKEHPKELVIGKRIRNENIPIKSKIGNEITKSVYHITTGMEIYDTQTGLRAFSHELLDNMLEISGDRYEYEMNMLLMFAKKGIKIKEIEIETIYIDNNSNSHFRAVKDSIIIYNQIIKFSFSSITSFLLDYLMYSLMFLFTQNLELSNIIARIISGSANYTINKRFVFKDNSKKSKSFGQYVTLAIVILFLNTTLLKFMVNILGLNAFISKIFVELILFILSWFIQKRVIFKEKGVERGKCLKIIALR